MVNNEIEFYCIYILTSMDNEILKYVYEMKSKLIEENQLNDTKILHISKLNKISMIEYEYNQYSNIKPMNIKDRHYS